MLITGASSGIGEALAREACARGARVVLAARRTDRLEALVGALGSDRAIAVPCDVSRDGEIERAVEAAHGFGPVEAVIANAGIAVEGYVEELTLEEYRRQFETNVFGVLRTVQAGLADLKRTRGVIGVVGSTNGYLALPGWSAYSMSKFAVRALCDSLRAELAEHGVRVTHVAPGFISTELRLMDREGNNRADFVPGWLQMSAPAAARRILRALARGRRELVLTNHARLGIALAQQTPGLTSLAVGWSRRWMRKMSHPPGGVLPAGTHPETAPNDGPPLA